MNGAEALVATAISQGIEVCFANPGATEMPLVVALEFSTRPLQHPLPARERGDRRSRRLWQDGGEAGYVPVASGAGSRQRPGQSAQRPPRFHARAERDWPTCHLAPACRSTL